MMLDTIVGIVGIIVTIISIIVTVISRVVNEDGFVRNVRLDFFNLTSQTADSRITS